MIISDAMYDRLLDAAAQAGSAMTAAEARIADLEAQLAGALTEVINKGIEVAAVRKIAADQLDEARTQIAAKDAALALFDAYYELPDRTREELEVKLAAWAAWLATRDALSQPARQQEDKS